MATSEDRPRETSGPAASAQAAREPGLSAYTAWRYVLRLRAEGIAQPVVLGLKSTGLDVQLDDERAYHFDLEGRLLKVATPNVHWRRGLSGRCVQLRKRSHEEGGGLESRLLDGAATDRLVDEASGMARQLHESLQTGRVALEVARPDETTAKAHLEDPLARAAAFDSVAARQDREQFRAIYGDIPILPPDQYGGFVLLATEGCAYNQCTFCTFYRDVRFAVKDPQRFRQHLEQAVAYHGRGLAMRRGVFLGQANALTAPPSWRLEILRIVNQQLQLPPPDQEHAGPQWWQGHPRRFDGIASFIDAFSGVKIPPGQFAEMRRLNLRQIYLGVETGSAELLQWLRKPATPDEMLAVVQAAKAAGVHVAVIVLLGAGGERFFDAHVAETVQLLNAMGLGRRDYIYLSPLVVPAGSPYQQQAEADRITPLSEARLRDQEQQLRAGLRLGPRQQRPYVARYEFAHFVY